MKIALELDSKEREFMAEAGTETKDYLKFMAEVEYLDFTSLLMVLQLFRIQEM